MTNRTELIKKIRNLRARASDEASSQAEANAAASRAAKLILEHEIGEDELRAMGTSGVAEGVHNDGRRRMHPTMDEVAGAIGRLTECKPLIRGGGANLWVGEPGDVEFALYLSEVIQGASERAWKTHLKITRRYSSPRNRKSYLMGFGFGVSGVLKKLAAERRAKRPATATGTSIVILKDQIINSYLDEQFGDIKEQRHGSQKKSNHTLVMAGIIDGGNCRVDRPVGQDEDLQRLDGDLV